MKKRSYSLLSWAVFLLSLPAFLGLLWFLQKGKPLGQAPEAFRKGMDWNAGLSKKLPLPPVRQFPKEMAAKKPRVNGRYGLKTPLDSAGYRLRVVHPIRKDTVSFSMEVLQAMPLTEVIFDFKCIEGWNQISWWGGTRFSDFMKRHFPELLDENGALRYAHVGLKTPDGKYYVGIDAESMMHPQTILCYQSVGQPLPLDQGYPLRLIIPVKYGIKHIKRIGFLSFGNTPQPDYWAERGYDYDAGH